MKKHLIVLLALIGIPAYSQAEDYHYSYPTGDTPPFEKDIGYPLERILKIVRTKKYQNIRLTYDVDDFGKFNRMTLFYKVKANQLFYYKRSHADGKFRFDRLLFKNVSEQNLERAIRAYNIGSYSLDITVFLPALQDVGCPVINLDTGKIVADLDDRRK